MVFILTPQDVAQITSLVRGQPTGESVTGVRTLSGVDNNLAVPDYGAADTPFLRLTDAHYGAFDVTSGNLGVNPLYAGLDPRNISNVIGQQEVGLPKAASGANLLFSAFGQYFDHGLSFLAKGNSGIIEIGGPGIGRAPGSDNPADLTRASVVGFDANGVPQHLNKTSNFIDQNQAYGSNDLVGTFLREAAGEGRVNAFLASGGDDPSAPGFALLPSLRELILMHWDNDTVFTSGNFTTTFRTYFPDLVDDNGGIKEAMLPDLYKNFMGSGQPLLIDLNPFISPLDHIVAGDGRVNENITLTSVHTIWARNHNFHVSNLEASGFVGTEQELFQAAKLINETEYQRIIYTEFADVLLGGMRGSGSHGWDGYNPNADPGISHEFAAAAYRFGHSLVTQTVQVKDANGQITDVALFDAFLNPTNDGQFLGALPPGYVPQPGYEQLGVSSILTGITQQAAEEVDANVVDAIRNDLARISADLFSFNVARGRDLGLGSLNQVRTDLMNSQDPYVREAIDRWAGNMSAYTSWEDFQTRNNISNALIEQLKTAYPDLVLSTPEAIEAFKLANPDITLVNGNTVKGIDRVDLWVGGLIEQHINDGMVGQTFWVIIHEQLDRLQEADRFYYLDRVDNFAFYDQIDGGAEGGFGAIIARNTGMVWNGENVFLTDGSALSNGGVAPVIVDREAPLVVDFSPADGSVGAEINANILLTFNEEIKFGQGVIELRLANGALVESFAMGSSPRVTIAGRVLTIDPTQALLGGSEYKITIAQGAVLDNANNAYAGTSTYDFATRVNVITGDQRANVLTGTAGGDEIFGLGGNDTLNGQAGNDRLDGGAGADRMTGGAGDDFYFVDNLGDRVIEASNEGDDTVSTSLARYTLADNVENVIYTGSSSFNGTGNALGNTMTGAAGADVMQGGGGNDKLSGLGGNDRLSGDAGDDVLNGGLGADWLNGGTGRDVFVFDTALSRQNIDTIQGFSVVDDTIYLSHEIFSELPTGALAAGAFNTGAFATQADDHIIFNTRTGALMYDADGAGGNAAVQFATLTSVTGRLTAGDIIIY